MRRLLQTAVVIIGVTSIPTVDAASGTFLESAWRNDLPSESVAVWSGGNESSVGPGTADDAPRSANGACLIESAIGQITPQTLGYPQSARDLAATADIARLAGNAYRYTQGSFGTVTNPAVAWNVVFPEGFNPSDGSTYGPGVTSTFDTNQLNRAEYALQSRLLGQNVILKEIPAIEQSRMYYQSACNIFSQLLDNPADASLVEGQSLLSASVTNKVAEILDSYLRNLANYAQASLADFQLRNFSDFRDPARQAPLPTGLLNEIDSAQKEIQIRLLLASPFQGLPVYTFSEAGRVQSLLRDIGRLHESIVLGRITFIAGASGDSSDSASLHYGEFTTSFVPLFPGLPINQGNSSFDVALSLAKQFTTDAISAETDAFTAVNQVLQHQFDYQSAQANLQPQYLGELVNLCGYASVDDQGNKIADAFFAAFPPGDRENIGAQFLNGNYNLPPLADRTGTIYQQWNSLAQAQTNLVLAAQQLHNTFSTMQEKQKVADAIAAGQRRIAELILTNGQQVAGLEVQKGEVQAEADLQLAQIEAEAAQATAENSAMFGAFEGITQLAMEDPQGVFTLGNAAVTLANGYENASAALQIGQVQARTARQLADLDAKITQINASERAAMQYEQADQTMLRLSEDLNSLRLQADSQKIQINLAAQQVDQERSKLANMLARVAYLLRQWSRSANLLAQNPQLGNDFLIERDSKMQRADDAFVLAEQWGFLAAQSFYYKDNCPDASTNQYVERILATRNASDLQVVLNQLQSDSTLLAAQCQSSVEYNTAHFSLRNDLFQFNLTQGEGTNTTYLSFEPSLLGTIVGSSQAVSDAAWTDILKRNLRTNQFGQRILVLDFSTSLALNLINGSQRNPLFECANFGATLYSGQDNNGSQLHGVQISVTTKGFQFPLGSSVGFKVQLAQLGTSVIRSRGFGCSNIGSSPAFRYFNFGTFYGPQIKAAANILDDPVVNPGTASFQDRSPANNQWELIINEHDSLNNAALVSNLDKVADIELRFAIRSYIDQCAAAACAGH